MTTATVSARDVIAKLDPAEIWGYFAELSAIPRPSKREERVRDWVLSIGARHGWKSRTDAVGNVVFDVPATPGCERAASVALQSHLDMVCEKNADVEFDFDRDPLRLRVDGDDLRATGTTLGADNGIGVCAALAAASAAGVRHGPLELLFTIDEETGLTGASAISPEIVKSRRMINLDSEEDDTLYIGCAGGRTTTLSTSLDLSAASADEAPLCVRVTGLRGGHSGGDIHECRGNANKLLARTLARFAGPFRLASIEGGNKHNAIPREAKADVLVPRDRVAECRKASDAALVEFRRVLAGIDDGVQVSVTDGPAGLYAADPGASRRLVDLVNGLPDGVLGVSRVIKGLVESSNNVAVISWEHLGASKADVRIVASSRSSSGPHLTAVLEQVAGVARLAGWKAAHSDGYPGWAPNPDSKLLEVCSKAYQRLFGEPPHVTAIHAGLECGVIGERIGGMDMISFGPTIRGAHSPDERVSIPSVQKFWRLLKAVLADLAA